MQNIYRLFQIPNTLNCFSEPVRMHKKSKICIARPNKPTETWKSTKSRLRLIQPGSHETAFVKDYSSFFNFRNRQNLHWVGNIPTAVHKMSISYFC